MTARRVSIPLWPEQTALGGESRLETDPIDVLRFAEIESLALHVASASGTARVKLELAVSNDGAAFTTYSDLDDLTAASGSEFSSAPTPSHTIPLSVSLAPFVRLRVIGLPGNPADTRIALTLWASER
jgi:hypothetical protein